MPNKVNLTSLWVIPFLGIALVIHTPTAYAGEGKDRGDHRGWGRNEHGRDRGRDWDRHGWRFPQHRAYPYGRVVVDLPGGFIRVVFGGARYYYSDGIFYRGSAHRYISVPPPMGAVIYTVPVGYQQVIIDGVVYYTYNGSYYRRVQEGYLAVDPPAPVVVHTVAEAPSPPVSRVIPLTGVLDVFTVNILNSKGGYTAVALTKSGAGYIGPQGEYYPELPKVEQLRVMYGQ